MKRIYKVRTIIAQWESLDYRGEYETGLRIPRRDPRGFSWLTSSDEISDELNGIIYIEERDNDDRLLTENVNYWFARSAAAEMEFYYDERELIATKNAAAELAWTRRHNPRFSELVAEEPEQVDFSVSPEQLPLGI